MTEFDDGSLDEFVSSAAGDSAADEPVPEEQWIETGDELVRDPNDPGELWPQTDDQYTDGAIDADDQGADQ